MINKISIFFNVVFIATIAGLVIFFNSSSHNNQIEIKNQTPTKTTVIKQIDENWMYAPEKITATVKNNKFTVTATDGYKTGETVFSLSTQIKKNLVIFSPGLSIHSNAVNYGGEVLYFRSFFNKFFFGGGIEIIAGNMIIKTGIAYQW
jgi:hypothetical protein